MSRRHAVVLSGGGAFAAYEIGVLRALCSGESPSTGGAAIDPAIVTGTSAGSYNGAMFVSRWAQDPLDALDEIERIWLTRVAGDACSSGVFRWRANPLDWVNVRCFLQSPQRYLWRRVEDLEAFGLGGEELAGPRAASPWRSASWSSSTSRTCSPPTRSRT